MPSSPVGLHRVLELAGVLPQAADRLDASPAVQGRGSGLPDDVVVADARDPVAVAAAIGEPVDVAVVCVDVPGRPAYARCPSTGSGRRSRSIR